MQNIQDLIDQLGDTDPVYIQTHNFPDHDAVASAYGLKYLFEHNGITCKLIYEGTIQRASLRALIEEMNIPIKPANAHPLTQEDKIIIVDGCKGNKNVTDLVGDEVAVIDHHNIEPGGVPDPTFRTSRT